MVRRRSSISRFLASIALVALGLALHRAGPEGDWRFGELTPLSTIGLVGGGLAFWTRGRPRRFFVGAGLSGLVVGLAFWAGPHAFRNFVLDRVICPLDARFAPALPGGSSMTRLEASLLLWMIETPETRRIRLTRSPFWSRESQEELGLLELAVSVIVGAIAATPWPARLGRANPPMAAPS